jgi:lipoprotein-anchoring transpeptidase ErfK/SrfK
MIRFAVALAAAIGTALPAVPASAAGLVAHINLSSQRMTVKLNGKPQYSWAISTGKAGYTTPSGTFRPRRLERHGYSEKYEAPMPHAIYFLGGYAIHGTNATGRLGRRASHGCVRLAPGNAAKLFSMVKKYGSGNTRIVVSR